MAYRWTDIPRNSKWKINERHTDRQAERAIAVRTRGETERKRKKSGEKRKKPSE